MSDSEKKSVIFILDRSGSMRTILESTIESFNGYLGEMRQEQQLEFTLVQFDTISTDTVHRRLPIANVPDLDEKSYVPRAATPLIDAVYATLISAKEAYKKGDRVVVTILTDGYENASVLHKMADLNALIKELSGWGWQFVFLGASIDAYRDAGQMGIQAGSTMSFDSANPAAMREAMATTAGETRSYLSTGKGVAYDRGLKARVGDRFAQVNKEEPE